MCMVLLLLFMYHQQWNKNYWNFADNFTLISLNRFSSFDWNIWSLFPRIQFRTSYYWFKQWFCTWKKSGHYYLRQWLPSSWMHISGMILCMHPANERRCYIVTLSLNGWVHTLSSLIYASLGSSVSCHVVVILASALVQVIACCLFSGSPFHSVDFLSIGPLGTNVKFE